MPQSCGSFREEGVGKWAAISLTGSERMEPQEPTKTFFATKSMVGFGSSFQVGSIILLQNATISICFGYILLGRLLSMGQTSLNIYFSEIP